ncbi:GNAT family N-acetyltransferase [Virgibacillus profundi]|uniref:GNAT family N-acetyltransferase n=1 Tax=Virgibacillus profundi TaxID=2024555 RepID=A0A2A2IED9_9BACI|nr:GNAT family protein [Virgibacillus profundi]PAV29686.1 GNAT family N-acetyltransferase [Virgibacillus profundi]PXY53858.1 N-acetyltransferase [Virgibacillus profundi]
MQLLSKNMTEKFAMEILSWQYTKPYDFYNNELTSEAIKEMLEESYYAIVDCNDELIGFFCIGKSAQVPVGNQYGAYVEDFVDVGLGMNPVFTGKGNGFRFFSYILRAIQESFPAKDIRLTVATFNERAIHLYEKLGFSKEVKFHTDTAEFITMVKQVK